VFGFPRSARKTEHQQKESTALPQAKTPTAQHLLISTNSRKGAKPQRVLIFAALRLYVNQPYAAVRLGNSHAMIISTSSVLLGALSRFKMFGNA
jgi:hypothetical protein